VAGPSAWLYAHSPLWLQNLGLSLYGLSYRYERFGGNFSRYVDEFLGRDRCSVSQLDSYVDRQLKAVLLQAFDEVPYYRKHWGAAQIQRTDLARLGTSRLHRLPITPKAHLRENPEAFVSERAARTGGLHRQHTSGSTGTPVTMICSSDDHRRFFAAREVRSFGWAGTSISSPRSMMGGRMVVPRQDAPPPYYRRNWAEKQVYFSAYHLSAAHAGNYVDGLNRYQPELLTGYAYSHYILAQFMLDQGRKLSYQPRALVLSSEQTTPEMKTTILAAFGARAFEEYGAVENCMLATECEHGRLHVNPDFGIVEIVDADGQPVPAGREGRIICTGLANRTQLLIRYDIGDVGSWAAEPCPCGRNHLPVLDQLVGRLEDVVIGRNGHVMVRFHGIFVNLPKVLEGQIVQESFDLIRVRIVVKEGFSDSDIQLIRQRLREERLGDMQIVVERVPALERTERGKFRAVINRLPKDILARALLGKA
jgi:phenylacetate-CoA ligase